MANTKQSTKRARQTKKRELHNAKARTVIRSSIKKALKALQAKDLAAAKTTCQNTMSTIDKAARHRIIHKNKAARLKSRLHAKLKGLAA